MEVAIYAMQMQIHHDKWPADWPVSVDDTVFLYATIGEGNKWIPGMIVQQTGPVSYKVQGGDISITYRKQSDKLKNQLLQVRIYIERLAVPLLTSRCNTVSRRTLPYVLMCGCDSSISESMPLIQGEETN